MCVLASERTCRAGARTVTGRVSKVPPQISPPLVDTSSSGKSGEKCGLGPHLSWEAAWKLLRVPARNTWIDDIQQRHEGSAFHRVLHATWFGVLDPMPTLKRLGEYNTIRRIHRSSDYIDTAGHPSIKGNRIIADRIYEYLTREPLK